MIGTCPVVPQEGPWERQGRTLERRFRPGLDAVPRAQPRGLSRLLAFFGRGSILFFAAPEAVRVARGDLAGHRGDTARSRDERGVPRRWANDAAAPCCSLPRGR